MQYIGDDKCCNSTTNESNNTMMHHSAPDNLSQYQSSASTASCCCTTSSESCDKTLQESTMTCRISADLTDRNCGKTAPSPVMATPGTNASRRRHHHHHRHQAGSLQMNSTRWHNRPKLNLLLLVCCCLAIISTAVGLQTHKLTPATSSSFELYFSRRPTTTRIKSPAFCSQTQRIDSTMLWSSKQYSSQQQSTKNRPAVTEVEPPIMKELREQTNLLLASLHSENAIDTTTSSTAESLSSSSQPAPVLDILKSMLSTYTNWIRTSKPKPSPQLRFKASTTIDKAFRLVTNEAFAYPYHVSWINLGLDALQLQLYMEDFVCLDTTNSSSSTTVVNNNPPGYDDTDTNNNNRRKLYSLQKPFNAIPRATWLKALRALTSNDISSTTSTSKSTTSIINNNSIKVLSSPAKVVSSEHQLQYTTPSNAAYRILQRLVKGWGVRTFASNKKRTEQQLALDERDFNMVLHSYARGLNNHHHHQHSLGHARGHTTSSTNDPIVNANVVVGSTMTHKNNHRQQTMHKMHSLMALQERTPHAPPLSPVAYSILLKAYGAANDIKNVDMSLQHAQRNGVVPDIVMVNTVLDAYVNCGLVDRAQSLVLREMKNGGRLDVRRVQGVNGDRVTSGEEEEQGGEVKSSFWSNLRPNSRTYNTLLKGLAETGDICPAMKLSKIIEAQNLWDDITTNTLVKVAVTAGEFDLAQVVLSNHTSSFRVAEEKQGQVVDHPNVEAYTELLDGYAKDSQLENALRVMQLMQQRGVHPNEYTYTCMVSALARNNKVRQARKMLTYAASTLGLPANNNNGNSNSNKGNRRKRRRRISLTPTYNAFISGLLSSNESEGSSHAANIVEILGVIQEMQDSTSSTNNNNSNVYIHAQPNVVTVSLVVDGLGKCNPPRCADARELVNHLEYSSRNNGPSGGSSRGISLSNKKIATALIRAYGRANEFGSALEMYQRILPTPDVVAFNALLDACCKCDQLKMALDLFGKHVNFKEWKEQEEESAMAIVPSGNKSVAEKKKVIVIKPDVVTYTTLISALLQLNSRAATKRANALYNEMMQKWWISPDTVIVDT